ncbi:MAG: hypothetical protein AAF629_23725 [Chloroflexota bacterium]
MKHPSLKIGAAIVILLITGLAVYLTVMVPAEFRAQTNPALACQSAVFDKSAFVFDVFLICGTRDVSAEKLSHAAQVAAEWLDNDEDGQVDEPQLLETLRASKPMVIMSANGVPITVLPRILPTLSDYKTQDLWAFETAPAGDNRDASQEEIHHLIMNAGWQTLFPATFSETASDNSTLYQAWKFADDNEYYVYNDPTCNASCKVTEFVYLATAAYMESGAEKDLASDEMRLKSRAALQEKIPSMIDIFEADSYVYPTHHWPDGQYPYPENIVFFGINE